MPLEELASRYEDLRARLSEQFYFQKAGLPFDRGLIKSLSEEISKVCLQFLENFKEPRSMYLESVSTIAQSESLEARLEFEERRMEIVCTEKYQLDGKKVNWGNWRQFNSRVDDPLKRKEVFDEFISKAPALAPLVERRFNISKEVYARYGLTPLDAYLELEGFGYDEVRDLLMKLGDGAREAFLKAAEHYAPEVLGKREYEYYDDYYTWRGRIYRPLNKYFEGMDPVKKVLHVLSSMGFDPTKIKVDDEDREKKSPSAFCFSIRVPDDVRVVFRRVSPFSDFGSVFHEFGHGIHGISGNPEDPVWKRYIVPMNVAETFSYLIESLLEEPLFLEEELNLGRDEIEDILDRRKFMKLAFLTFYAANGVMKMEFWRNNYSAKEAAKRWQELTKRFFLEVPGNYWLLHHIMPNYEMYSPSYVIAALRVLAIKRRLREEFGERWWTVREAGEFIRRLAETRGEFNVREWKLDPDGYLKEYTSLSFL